MSRRGPGRAPESYVSTDPARRAAQLANLRKVPPVSPGRPPSHGAYARVAVERLAEKEREVFDALAADAPLRDRDNDLPAADGALVRLAADALCRLDSVGDFLARRGIEDEKGQLRATVLELEGRLRREASDHLEALGMSPRSRARLGVDVARAATFDLAKHWAGEHDDVIDAEEVGADG
ncbi:MAG: hypothetical protein Q8O56_10420 [Solirubrobacteraceae bacterium]|nr:hypothetical protein [Solirubrobacteraceae bacterium]